MGRRLSGSFATWCKVLKLWKERGMGESRTKDRDWGGGSEPQLDPGLAVKSKKELLQDLHERSGRAV